MKKIHLILGLTAGGAALFLLSIFIILAAKGRLNNETLTRLPLVGGFFGRPVPIIIAAPKTEDSKGAEELEKTKPAAKEIQSPITEFTIPSPFNSRDLNELAIQMEEAKERYEKGQAEIDKQKEDLAKERMDLDHRWDEMTQLAAKLEEIKKKIEEDFKSLRQGKANNEAEEQENIRMIANWYMTIDSAQTLANLVKGMGADKASKILEELSKDDDGKAKAGEILAALDALAPSFATEVMGLTLKRKKSTP